MARLTRTQHATKVASTTRPINNKDCDEERRTGHGTCAQAERSGFGKPSIRVLQDFCQDDERRTVTYPTKDKRPTCSYPLAKLMKEVLDDKVKKVVVKNEIDLGS